MKAIKQSIADAYSYFLPSVRNSLTTLIPLLLITSAFHQYFSYAQKTYAMDNLIMIYSQLGKLMTGFLEGGVLILLIPLRYHEAFEGLQTQSWLKFAQKHFMPLFVDSIRALVKVIMWLIAGLVVAVIVSTLLGANLNLVSKVNPTEMNAFSKSTLVIFVVYMVSFTPAIFKYIRFSLFPYVIYFNEAYYKDEIDSLKSSSDLVQGNGFWIFAVMFVQGLIFYFSIKWYEGLNLPILQHTAGLLFVKFFNLMITVFTYGIFYSIYRQSTDRLQNLEGEGV